MKTQEVALSNHPLADGTTSTVTVTQWKNTVGYKVFMYIANQTTGSAPADEWPNPSEPSANGTWYLVAETQDNYAEIDCPKVRKIAFWVGAVIRLSDTSNTAGIEKVPFTSYQLS